MHLVLLPNNKALMFDTTLHGPSKIQLPPNNCRVFTDKANKTQQDCWAHAVEYDIDTAQSRPLKLTTDPWCSGGGLSADGTFVQSGGWFDGGRGVRYFVPCNDCDWTEFPTALSVQRWYATQQILPDGSFIVIGGRRQFNYEFIPAPGVANPTNFKLPFLRETSDAVEDNLYPFVNLLPDGSLFIFANNRSILLSPQSKSVIRELPVLEGGARNYPGSAMSALLPIKLTGPKSEPAPVEIIVCGGTPHGSAAEAAKGEFLPALSSCGRIMPLDSNPKWEIETMPTARVMGDMLLLPTTEVLIINGAKKGSAGWNFASEPNLAPLLYKPMKEKAQRFIQLSPSTIPRMYHSTSAVLPDGRILVAGSNTNNGYNFTGVTYPTELRVEKFSPPYLDPQLMNHRPAILPNPIKGDITYGQTFSIPFKLVGLELELKELKVTMYAPPLTTHGYSMNQRLLILSAQNLKKVDPSTHALEVLAPSMAEIAPPGYYLLFVVHRGVPSEGLWVRIN